MSSGSEEDGHLSFVLADQSSKPDIEHMDEDGKRTGNFEDSPVSDIEPMAIDPPHSAANEQPELRSQQATAASHGNFQAVSAQTPILRRSDENIDGSVTGLSAISECSSSLEIKNKTSEALRSSGQSYDDQDGLSCEGVSGKGTAIEITDNQEKVEKEACATLSEKTSDKTALNETCANSQRSFTASSDSCQEETVSSKGKESYESERNHDNQVHSASGPVDLHQLNDGYSVGEDVESTDGDEVDDDVLHIDLTGASRSEENPQPEGDEERTCSDPHIKSKTLELTSKSQAESTETTEILSQGSSSSSLDLMPMPRNISIAGPVFSTFEAFDTVDGGSKEKYSSTCIVAGSEPSVTQPLPIVPSAAANFDTHQTQTTELVTPPHINMACSVTSEPENISNILSDSARSNSSHQFLLSGSSEVPGLSILTSSLKAGEITSQLVQRNPQIFSQLVSSNSQGAMAQSSSCLSSVSGTAGHNSSVSLSSTPSIEKVPVTSGPADFQPLIVSVRGNCDLNTEEELESRNLSEQPCTSSSQVTQASAVIQELGHLVSGKENSDLSALSQVGAVTMNQGGSIILVPASQKKSLNSLLNLAQKTVGKGTQPVVMKNIVSSVGSGSTTVKAVFTAVSTAGVDSSQVRDAQKPTQVNVHEGIRHKPSSATTSCSFGRATKESTSCSVVPSTSMPSILLPDGRTAYLKNLVVVPQSSTHVNVSSSINKSVSFPAIANTQSKTSLTRTGDSMSHTEGTSSNDLPIEETTLTASNEQSTEKTMQSASNESSIEETTRSKLERIVANTLKDFGLDRSDLEGTNILGIKFSPTEGIDTTKKFFCSACKDRFHSKVGLEYHLHRKSFRLRYFCQVCKKVLVFYNKCKFWIHLNFESSPPFERFLNETSFLKLDQTNLMTPDHIAESETMMDKMLSLDETKERAVCPGCCKKFATRSDLSLHLGSSPVSRTLKCSVCQMNIPSACAFKAHTIIHKVTPTTLSEFWCPECGCGNLKLYDGEKTCRPVFDHLDSCFHFNRVMPVFCECKKMFFDEISIKEHFLSKHMQYLYKCAYCTLAFLQDNGKLHDHCLKIHKKQMTDVAPLLFCSLCNVVCKAFSDVEMHLEQHFKQCKAAGPQFPWWKCFICQRSFANKEALLNHADSEHTHKAKRCTLCFSLFSNRKNLVDHIVLKKCQRTPPAKLNVCVDILPDNAASCYSKLDYQIRSMLAVRKVQRNDTAVAPTTTAEPVSIRINTPVSASTPHTTHDFQLRVAFSDTQARRRVVSSTATLVPKKRKITSKRTDDVDREPHQCHTCKIVLQGSENFSGHLLQHALKGRYISKDVTRCVICKRLISNSVLTAHIRKHQIKGVKICSKCQRRDFKTMKEAIAHGEKLCGYRYVTGEGEIVDDESENAIPTGGDQTCSTGEDQEESTMDCNENDRADEDSNDTVEDRRSSQTVLVPCLLCGMTFMNKADHDEHVSRMHDGTRIVYYCLVCKKRGKEKIFKQRKLVVKHITVKHRVTNVGAINKLIKREEQNVTSGKELVASTADASTASPPKRLRIEAQGDFLCGKCAFSCSDGEEFSKHVVTHNSKGEPQCPECGLCFTVVTAMKKHLFAVHKIKKIDEYLTEKGLLEPEEEDDDEANDTHPVQVYPLPPTPSETIKNGNVAKRKAKQLAPANPLECTVCYKVFDTEIALKTHMRNHGMAFIRSRRHKV